MPAPSSSRPRWVARQVGRTRWEVRDADSERAYRLDVTTGGHILAVWNITVGRKIASLNPRGRAARELIRAVKAAQSARRELG